MPTNSQVRKYYPSIDGLRAIAVLLVVVFHFDVKGLNGGFVGVDVFFVISGFLITRNIQASVNSNSFSFWLFYRARLRRLYPALLVTIGVTLILSTLLLSPDHLKSNGLAAIASTLSVSNLYFWNEAGYFDTDAVVKPLLHFWSLSVEEQYYLFWPATLFLILKFVNNSASQALLILALIAISAYSTEAVLLSEPDKAFYWFHLRIYEFLIGAILVWLPTDKDAQRGILQSALTVSGISLILYSGITYNHSTSFPGFNALLPCGGAALIILSKTSTASRLLLANFPMRWLGKVSYSIYLVHWPVWVLYGYWKFDTISPLEKSVLGLITLGLACALHYFIEVKFRYSNSSSNRDFYLSTLVATSAIILASIAITLYSGLPKPNKQIHEINQIAELTCHLVDNNNPKLQEKKCIQKNSSPNAKRILVIGDSHAGHLIAGLRKFSIDHAFSLETWTFSGCPPVWGTYKIYGIDSRKLDYKEEHCKLLIPEWRDHLAKNKYNIVVLASRWDLLIEPTTYTETRIFRRDFLVDAENPTSTLDASRETLRNKLQITLEEIVSVQPRKLILIGQVPLLARNIQGCDKVPKLLISDKEISKRCSPHVSYQKMVDRLKFSNNVIKNLENENVLSLLPSDVICSDEHKECKTTIDGDALYRDDNHFSTIGSQYYISSVTKEILTFLEGGSARK